MVTEGDVELRELSKAAGDGDLAAAERVVALLRRRGGAVEPLDSIDAYQSFTETTAVYPGVGKRTTTGVLYNALGKAEETGEYLEKLLACVRRAWFEANPGVLETPKALGDVIIALEHVVAYGKECGKLKRPIREGRVKLPDLPPPTQGEIEGLVAESGDGHWYDARGLAELGVRSSEVLASNKAKLEDRKARNAIHGSGDKR